MKLFPIGGRFFSYGFTLYTNSQTTAMPSKATKWLCYALGANRIQLQMDLEMTFNYSIKRNDLIAKEIWQFKCHISFFFRQARWAKPMPPKNFPGIKYWRENNSKFSSEHQVTFFIPASFLEKCFISVWFTLLERQTLCVLPIDSIWMTG